MKKLSEKIIKVEFFMPVQGKKEHYFGSLAAIYEVFTPEQIGCRLGNLWNAKIEVGKPKKTKKCTIYKHSVLRKKHK